MNTTSSVQSPAGGEAPADAGDLRVGFIGLGSQGGPIARRIVEAGFPTTLWARRPESLDPYADTAATLAATPAELAAICDVVCVCVVDDAGVDDLLTAPDGLLSHMAPRSTVVIHSTISPATVERLAEAAHARGVDLVDAPVSGGGPAATAGRLLVMIGGDPDVVARIEPILASYASPIVHVGALGSGQLAKLLNNTLLAANLAVAAGVLSMGRDLGVEPSRLAEVIASGTGSSRAMSLLATRDGDLSDMARGAGPLLRKDVQLLADAVERSSAGSGDGAAVVWHAADAALREMRHPRE